MYYPSNEKSKPKAVPKLLQSHPHMRKSPQSDPKVAPKSTSHVKSDAKVTPKSHSYAKMCPKMIDKLPHSFIQSLKSRVSQKVKLWVTLP